MSKTQSKTQFTRHLLDFSGSSLASAAATTADAVIYALFVYTLVRWEFLSLGLAAGIGALVGGVIHYTICRFWVFRRFEAPLFRSAAIYFAMSWLAAVGHGLFTGWLAGLAGAALAWAISKAVIWVAWTYPMSRYVVFYDTSQDISPEAARTELRPSEYDCSSTASPPTSSDACICRSGSYD